MGIILDIIILCILGLSIFLGYRKGLISVIFNLCALFLAIILTWILYTPISNLIIENTQLDEKIEATIIEKGVVESDGSNLKNGEKNEYLEEFIKKAINEKKNEAVKNTAGILAEKTVSIIVAVGLFIILRIGLIFIKFIANGIAELPLIKQFNKAGGILYGILRGIIIICAIFTICFILISVNNAETISQAIETSIISKFIFNIMF